MQHFFAQLRNIAAYERFLIFFPCIHVCSLFAQYWPGQFHLNVFQLYLTHFRVSHLSTEIEKATDMADNPFFSAPKSSGIKSLLDKDSEIPTDISFEIVDGTEIVTLKAHKLILAAHSVFFRKAFFGSGLNFKESSGTVIIKETTKEAFEAMIDFIYEKNKNFGSNQTVEQLFDLLNISKRYQVDELSLAILNHFKNFPWTRNNLSDLNNVEEFKQFPDETEALFKSAANFFKKNFTSVKDMHVLCETSTLYNRPPFKGDLVVRLLAETKKLRCDVCKWSSCKHGEMIRGIEELKPGQLVKTKPMHHWRERYRGKVCQVISVDKESEAVELHFLNPPSPGDDDMTNPYKWQFQFCDLLFVCNSVFKMSSDLVWVKDGVGWDW